MKGNRDMEPVRKPDREMGRLLADDPHDRELLARVHPPGWNNPEPAPRYNLVVIGAGTAGLVTAAGAAGLGAKVALVERHLMGGDCLNFGCVPSKCLVRSSRLSFDVKAAERFGVNSHRGGKADFAAVMERMRRVRARMSAHDSAERFRSLGVDVFLGEGRFWGHDTVEVDGKALRFSRAVIATGTRAAVPDIEGLAEAGYRTNETIYSLTELPPRLVVVGAGPVGVEMAQAFRRFGSHVTVVERAQRFLAREDPDAADLLHEAFRREGIDVRLGATPVRVTAAGKEKRILLHRGDGNEDSVIADEILIGAGRAPNVEGLNLEAAGVRYDRKRGVEVDDFLRTSNRRIYAAGDICLDLKFTHSADASARIAIRNALFPGKKRVSALTIPWCTFTDPEIASVGMREREAVERGIPMETFTTSMSDVDRAVTDGEEEGFVKIHVRKGTGRILGATVVARHAGDLIGMISLAMAGNMDLSALAEVIYPYPTLGGAVRQIADAYNRTRLTPSAKKLLEGWLRWTR